MRVNSGDIEIGFDFPCWHCVHGRPIKKADLAESETCTFCAGIGRITSSEGDELIAFLERHGFRRKK